MPSHIFSCISAHGFFLGLFLVRFLKKNLNSGLKTPNFKENTDDRDDAVLRDFFAEPIFCEVFLPRISTRPIVCEVVR